MCIDKRLVFQVFYIQDGPDLIVLRELDKVLNGPTLAGLIAFRDLVDIQPETPAFLREEDHRMMGGGDEEVFYIVFVPGLAADVTPASAALLAVFGGGSTFDISQVRDGDHHVFF